MSHLRAAGLGLVAWILGERRFAAAALGYAVLRVSRNVSNWRR